MHAWRRCERPALVDAAASKKYFKTIKNSHYDLEAPVPPLLPSISSCWSAPLSSATFRTISWVSLNEGNQACRRIASTDQHATDSGTQKNTSRGGWRRGTGVISSQSSTSLEYAASTASESDLLAASWMCLTCSVHAFGHHVRTQEAYR